MIEFDLPKNQTRVWDLDVPIVQEKNTTNAYITNSIEDPDIYNELCYLLQNATETDVFNIHLNTPGGQIDSAFMVVDAIKNSKAKTTACLSGTVASAGTIIALACNDLIVADHTAFMVHNYTGGIAGKGHELKARQEFIDNSLESAFCDIYLGFLSNDEIREIIDGKDIWMGKDEILKRFKSNKET